MVLQIHPKALEAYGNLFKNSLSEAHIKALQEETQCPDIYVTIFHRLGGHVSELSLFLDQIRGVHGRGGKLLAHQILLKLDIGKAFDSVSQGDPLSPIAQELSHLQPMLQDLLQIASMP
ncbi:hypothetical protein ACJX0J_028120 [Zea mays]